MEFLVWLSKSPLGVWVSESFYGYYLLLAGHAIGMGVVVGTIYMMSARVLGFRKGVPFELFDRLFRIAWAGFGLNFLTGLGLFSANGQHLIENTPFLLKLTFIALGGVAVWILGRTLDAERDQLQATGVASLRAKSAAVLAITLWTAAIVAGRIIAYTIKYY